MWWGGQAKGPETSDVVVGGRLRAQKQVMWWGGRLRAQKQVMWWGGGRLRAQKQVMWWWGQAKGPATSDVVVGAG